MDHTPPLIQHENVLQSFKMTVPLYKSLEEKNPGTVVNPLGDRMHLEIRCENDSF